MSIKLKKIFQEAAKQLKKAKRYGKSKHIISFIPFSGKYNEHVFFREEGFSLQGNYDETD